MRQDQEDENDDLMHLINDMGEPDIQNEGRPVRRSPQKSSAAKSAKTHANPIQGG